MNKSMAFAVAVIIIAFVAGSIYCVNESKQTVENIVKQIQAETNANRKRTLHQELMYKKDFSSQDMEYMRKLLKNDKHTSESVVAVIESIKNMNSQAYSKNIASMIEDEEGYIKKMDAMHDKSDTESAHRAMNTVLLIRKLGELKDKETIPTLKRMLKYKYTAYYASESLASMGDNSASKEIKALMEQGNPVNYGGLGIDEAKDIINDLRNINKKDKWDKICLQLAKITNPEAKPYLRQLFSHENNAVRLRASLAFASLVDSNDIETIIEMSKDKDWNIRTSSIYAMQRIRNRDFKDVLANLLLNDQSPLVRSNAAHALGYKKVMNAAVYLEKAINDENVNVRRSAFYSLYVITGKKYDFIGKDKNDDNIAEMRKEIPSFYR